MGEVREKRYMGGHPWVNSYFGGGGSRQKVEREKLADGLQERRLPQAGDYLFIIKPVRDYNFGIRKNIIKESYTGQVVRIYPQLMEIRKFEKGKSLRGRNGLEHISLVDIKKSKEVLIFKLDHVPEVDFDSDIIDAEMLIHYFSLYPEKKSEEKDVFKVKLNDYVLVNSRDSEEDAFEDCYIAHVVYQHTNMIMVKEFRHGCTMGGTVRSIIRDEILRGLVKLFRLKMKPEETFTRDEMKYENFSKEHEDYLA